MPETRPLSVDTLVLDLQNFRTLPQKNETRAVHAMVSTSPDRFWALTESLLDSGYLPTESVIVLKSPDGSQLVVKEGNRRVAALKLALGLLKVNDLDMPDNIRDQIAALPEDWKNDNLHVPCTIYDARDEAIVDRIVTLAHGKGDRASREHWKAIARARHNRKSGGTEPALDLLEKYLRHGKNLNQRQKDLWAGNFPLTVLEEAMKRLAPRFDQPNSTELAKAYPHVSSRDALENMILAIGMETLDFATIRARDRDFGVSIGLAPAPAAKSGQSKAQAPTAAANSGGAGHTPAAKPGKTKGEGAPRALAAGDQKSVRRCLKRFQPRGKNREKVVTLRDEAILLDLDNTPIAFCFLLRSMFEISAKAYCKDQAANGGPSASKNGMDRNLVDILRDIYNFATKNGTDTEKKRLLHGAMTELAGPHGILSVTSMNQLVHNPRFFIAGADIPLVFSNVFPLLEEMNS